VHTKGNGDEMRVPFCAAAFAAAVPIVDVEPPRYGTTSPNNHKAVKDSSPLHVHIYPRENHDYLGYS